MLAQHCAASAAPPRGCVRASRRGRGCAAQCSASAAVASAAAAAAPPPARITHARQAGVQLRRAGWSDVKAVAEARAQHATSLSLSLHALTRVAAPQLCAAAFADVPGSIPKGAHPRGRLCAASRAHAALSLAGNPNVEGLNEYLVTSYVAATSRQVTKAMALALSQKARATQASCARSCSPISRAARQLTLPRDARAGGGRDGDAAHARRKARRSAARRARGREGARCRRGLGHDKRKQLRRRRRRSNRPGGVGRATDARRRGGAAVVAALGARTADARPAVDLPACAQRRRRPARLVRGVPITL